MSNAAVIKLDDKSIAGDHVWLDDNFGESIHLHINDFRCDMTHGEFKKLRDDMIESLNSLIQIEGFDAGAFDPVFLEQYLWKRLSRLEKILFDEVYVKDLYEGGRHVKPLKKCKIYREMCGRNVKYKAKPGRKIKSISEQERIKLIKDSIFEEGYNPQRGYIILYGDDNIVRDGRHRACAILCANPNARVKVMRMYFKGENPLNVKLRSALRAPSFRIRDVIGTFSDEGYFSLKGAMRLAIKAVKNILGYKDRLIVFFSKILYREKYKTAEHILNDR